jgi:phenylacetaldehyde dehydrogenase
MDIAASHARLGNAASTFLTGRRQLLIDGKWVDAKSGKKFDVFDPATGQAIAAVAEADAADVDEAVEAARRAFETGRWAKTSPQDRCKQIWKLADFLEANADEIAEIESLDNGYPIRDARNVDLPGSYEILCYMAGWATKINGETITVSAPGDWHAYTLREPVGVVGQIIPWNFPLMMAAWKIAPALAAGCTIVLKPAEQTPLSRRRRTRSTSRCRQGRLDRLDRSRQIYLARRIKAGSVSINTQNFGDPALPFGGFKQSGWGREMGFEAIELYTEVKSVAAAL